MGILKASVALFREATARGWGVELWECASSTDWVEDKLESGHNRALGHGRCLGGENTVNCCAENELVAVLGVGKGSN